VRVGRPPGTNTLLSTAQNDHQNRAAVSDKAVANFLTAGLPSSAIRGDVVIKSTTLGFVRAWWGSAGMDRHHMDRGSAG